MPPPAPAPASAGADSSGHAGRFARSSVKTGRAADAGSGAAEVVGDDPAAAAGFLLAARSLLIDDSARDLVLLPHFPTAWRGGNVEVDRLPTRHGELSFGIRWHGARPALLWQLDGGEPAAIRCPGLDPDWSTTERRGETLLAGSAEGLLDAPGPGDSFT